MKETGVKTSSRLGRFLSFSLILVSLLGYTLYNQCGSNYKHAHNNLHRNIPKNSYSDIDVYRPSFNSKKSRFIYTDPEFRNQSLLKYQGAIRVPTQVYDDSTRPEIDLKDWHTFLRFHEYLQETFPLVHQHLKLEKVNKLGLIYTFDGSDGELAPLVFTAHQDVVPVDEDTLDRWSYDPFSGHFDGKYVWGRGTADTKSLLVALLETFEELIKDGFKPKRTLIISLGYDEETIGRYDGAKSLVSTLQDRYGPKGVYALIDEGGYVTNVGGSWIAAPGIAEKGYIDVYIELKVPGGHSSVPPDHTSIGIIGQLTTLIEKTPYDPLLTDENPFLKFLRAVGETSPLLDEDTKRDYVSAQYDLKARARVVESLSKIKSSKYNFQTSQAIDLIQAGVKINALPEVLSLGINHRISHGLTTEDVISKIVSNVAEIAEINDLGISLGNGTSIKDQTETGFFNISWVQPLDPSPISSTEGPIWDVFAGSIKHTFEDIVLQNQTVTLGPTLIGGYTDASRYWPLTDNVYRFIGFAAPADSAPSNAHAIDEKFPFDQHVQAVAFLYDYILNVNEFNS